VYDRDREGALDVLSLTLLQQLVQKGNLMALPRGQESSLFRYYAWYSVVKLLQKLLICRQNLEKYSLL
jgi:hypothetical protein